MHLSSVPVALLASVALNRGTVAFLGSRGAIAFLGSRGTVTGGNLCRSSVALLRGTITSGDLSRGSVALLRLLGGGTVAGRSSNRSDKAATGVTS